MRWLRPIFQADAATITIEEFDNLRSVSWTVVLKSFQGANITSEPR